MLKKHIFSDRVPISLHICPAHMIGGTGCRFREKPNAYEGSWIERKNCIWGLGIGKSSQCPRGRLVGSGKNERMFGVAHFLEKKLKLLDKSKFRPMR